MDKLAKELTVMAIFSLFFFFGKRQRTTPAKESLGLNAVVMS